jgi:hypothetical protein
MVVRHDCEPSIAAAYYRHRWQYWPCTAVPCPPRPRPLLLKCGKLAGPGTRALPAIFGRRARASSTTQSRIGSRALSHLQRCSSCAFLDLDDAAKAQSYCVLSSDRLMIAYRTCSGGWGSESNKAGLDFWEQAVCCRSAPESGQYSLIKPAPPGKVGQQASGQTALHVCCRAGKTVPYANRKYSTYTAIVNEDETTSILFLREIPRSSVELQRPAQKWSDSTLKGCCRGGRLSD